MPVRGCVVRDRVEAVEHVERLEACDAAVRQDRPMHGRVAVGDCVWLGDARLVLGHVLAREDAADLLDVVCDLAADLAFVEVAPPSSGHPLQRLVHVSTMPHVIGVRRSAFRHEVLGGRGVASDDGLKRHDGPGNGVVGEPVREELQGRLDDLGPIELPPALPHDAHAGHHAGRPDRERAVDVRVVLDLAEVLALVCGRAAG